MAVVEPSPAPRPGSDRPARPTLGAAPAAGRAWTWRRETVDVALDQLAETGFNSQTGMPVIRIHLGVSGAPKLLCGKGRDGLVKPPKWSPEYLCRSCADEARAQKLEFP